MKKLKIVMISLVIITGILSTNNKASAFNYDIAMNKVKLNTIDVKISEFKDNNYIVDVTSQIAKVSYGLSPDNCYYGEIVINNDQNYSVTLQGLETFALVENNSNYTIDEYEIVLNEWFTYSFSIDSKGITVPDTPVNKFAGAQMINYGTALSSEGGSVNFNDRVQLAPQESIVLYYDFSFDWHADNRTINMPYTLMYALTLQETTNYKIETSVVNGTIDKTIEKIGEGTSTTIHYNANEGYEIDKLIVDREEQDIILYANAYTFENIGEDHQIEVFYKAMNYTITYELDGGVNDSGNPFTYVYGEGIRSFKEPSKKGYIFLGWIDSEGNIVETIGSTEQGNKVLSAIWEKKQISNDQNNHSNQQPSVEKPSEEIEKPVTHEVSKVNVENISKGPQTGLENTSLYVYIVSLGIGGYVAISYKRKKG